MTPLQKLPKNVKDLGKLIVVKGFKKLPKVQKIAQSGHSDSIYPFYSLPYLSLSLPFELSVFLQFKVNTDTLYLH